MVAQLTRSANEQEQLLLLDAIFHVPATAVFALVQGLIVESLCRQRRHDEAWIGALVQVLGLTHNAT